MKTLKLNQKELIQVKEYYESEYTITMNKLAHIRKMLKKLKGVNTVQIRAEKDEVIEKKSVKPLAAKPGRPAGRPKARVAKPVVSKAKAKPVKKAKATKKEVAPKSETARPYTRWSKIITGVFASQKKTMQLKDIVAACIKNQGIRKKEDVKRAKHSIQILVYRLRDNKKINEYMPKGAKVKSFGLPGWFKNGQPEAQYTGK